MYGKIQKKQNENGFTLVELLVAMAISVIVMASIGYVYYTQQKSYVAQEQISSMQQNLRAAMYYMEREIRMAGFDPTEDAGAGINIANNAELEFTVDYNGNGTCTAGETNEQIRYHLTNDADDDGIADGSPCNLGRETWGGGLQTVAENIDALDFVYLDADGNITGTIADIRSVQVTIVARVGKPDPGYTNTNAYFNQRDAVNPILPAQNDSFRRRRLTTTIKCRNL